MALRLGPVKVGMAASLTGQFGGQGSQALEGVAAWVRDTNAGGGIYVRDLGGKAPLQLVHYDDQSTPQVARTMTQKLMLDDGVDLLLGPYSSVLTMACAPVAERLHRVLWNHGGASDQIWSRGFYWVIGVLSPASGYLLGVIDLVKEKDPAARRVAILHSSTGTFSPAVALGAESHAVQEGFQTVFTGQYRSPAVDFSSLLDEMEARHPDVILGVGRIQDDMLLARQVVQRGTRAKAIALVAAGIEQFREALGSGADGFLGPSQWEPGMAGEPDYGPSAQEVARGWPQGSDYALAQAYAAGLVAQRCVEEAGTLDNHALREAAHHLDFTTFFGRFKVEPATGRQIGRSVLITQWQGDEKVVLWPWELQQGDMLYPIHP